MRNREELKKKLYEKTGCDMQYDGWCCGTCFFSLSDDFDNQDWQTLLFYRGDYGIDELDNLPENMKGSLNKIWRFLKNENI